jgi:hypothetical protein
LMWPLRCVPCSLSICLVKASERSTTKKIAIETASHKKSLKCVWGKIKH